MWRTTRTPVNHRLHALSTDTRNREYAVADPQAPAPILRRLAKDKDHTVTRELSPEILQQPTTSSSRSPVMKNLSCGGRSPSTPPPLLHYSLRSRRTKLTSCGLASRKTSMHPRGSCCPRYPTWKPKSAGALPKPCDALGDARHARDGRKPPHARPRKPSVS